MLRPIVTQYPTDDDWNLSSCARRAGVPPRPCSAPTAWSWRNRPLISGMLVLLALSVSVVPGLNVASQVSAQSEDGFLVYDYDGDGDVTCTDDFVVEFPSTYTEEATTALSLYPDELGDLDRDNDGMACDPSGDDAGGDAAPAVDDTAEEPLDIEPVPSDLPPVLDQTAPVAVADPEPVAPIEAPADCDVIVENGRAFVYTDCADGTVQAGFQPFAGFDDFAARAQNGFGAFDDVAVATEPVTTVETQLPPLVTEPATVPVTAPLTAPSTATGGTSQERAAGGPQVVEGAQSARSTKATAKAKPKAKERKAKLKVQERKAKLKAKKLKRAKERKAKQARLERLRQSRRQAD